VYSYLCFLTEVLFRSITFALEATFNIMSSADASTSTFCARKTTKNMAGLSLDLSQETLTSQPPDEEFPITACSPSTPSLEFDWNSDDSYSYELEDDSEAQFVYIQHDSPFYRSTTPCSSAYIAFTSFPFTCDALREDGSMFRRSPYFTFQEKADYEDAQIAIVDGETEASLDPRQELDWNSREFDGIFLLEQSKPAVLDFEEPSSFPY